MMTPERLAEIRRYLAPTGCGDDQYRPKVDVMAVDLLAEVDRLARWKAEATEVMLGLQDLGRALNLPLGERVTGPAALAEIDRLRAQLMNVERYVERVSAKPANAWDQGHESAIDGCPCRNPNARDCVNPYRQALS